VTDTLRRRAHRGEEPLELLVGTVSSADPVFDDAALAESVSLALYVVMDALTPAERVSFVLHDVFDVPFDAIAAVLGRSTAATKMLAGPARPHRRRPPASWSPSTGARSRSWPSRSPTASSPGSTR
jgi:RNA polymerase sigma-70 factor (ECF subfamily)